MKGMVINKYEITTIIVLTILTYLAMTPKELVINWLPTLLFYLIGYCVLVAIIKFLFKK